MCVANRSFSYPSVSCTRSEENCAKKHHAHNQLMPGHNPSKRAYAGRAFALPGHCSAFARQIFKWTTKTVLPLWKSDSLQVQTQWFWIQNVMNLHQPGMSDFHSAEQRCMKKEDRMNQTQHELILERPVSQPNRRISTCAINELELDLSGEDTLERARRDLTWISKMSAGELPSKDLGLLAAADFCESHTAVSIPDQGSQIITCN